MVRLTINRMMLCLFNVNMLSTEVLSPSDCSSSFLKTDQKIPSDASIVLSQNLHLSCVSKPLLFSLYLHIPVLTLSWIWLY